MRKALDDCGESEEPSGTALFAAIRVVFVWVRSSAGAAIKDLAHAGFPGLSDKIRREIHFVLRRTNAGTNLQEDIRRIAAKIVAHCRDRSRNDSKFGASLTGVDEANRSQSFVCNVDGSAVGDVNRQAESALIGDKSVRLGNRGPVGGVNSGDAVAMNLFRKSERHLFEAERFSRLALNGKKAGQDLISITGDIDARAALDESRSQKI
jgi:hypothetical protein